MELLPFDVISHLPILNSWLVKREVRTLPGTEVPEIGYIVTDGVQFIACAFLRRVEGGFGQLDGYATNPDVSSDLRDKSQDLISEKLIKHAKDLCITGLICTSTYSNTIKRAERHGFKQLPVTFLALDLRSL